MIYVALYIGSYNFSFGEMLITLLACFCLCWIKVYPCSTEVVRAFTLALGLINGSPAKPDEPYTNLHTLKTHVSPCRPLMIITVPTFQLDTYPKSL